jgi:putative ABC transport system permease protein
MVLRNRRRYKAVMAGIAFGAAGFIIIQTMGDSVERKMGEHLELLGEATVITAEWNNEENYHPGHFDWNDIYTLRKIPEIIAVAPIVSIWAVEVQSKNLTWIAGLSGVDHQYWRTQSAELQEGRLIGPSDVVARRKVAVVGKDVIRYLFNRDSPVGKRVKMANLEFEIIGSLGGIQHSSMRRSVFIPITTAENIVPGLQKIKKMYIRVRNWNDVSPIRELVYNVLRSNHKGYEKGIKVTHYPKRVQKVQSTVGMVKIFIYAALCATLLLGGIGITNVMLSAVQDRTQEIGLRKALGARGGHILFQFLTESIMISGFAGLLGVTIGVMGVLFLKELLQTPIQPSVLLQSIIAGLAFTAFLGVASGIYPSIKAGRLDSVSAMRFE